MQALYVRYTFVEVCDEDERQQLTACTRRSSSCDSRTFVDNTMNVRQRLDLQPLDRSGSAVRTSIIEKNNKQNVASKKSWAEIVKGSFAPADAKLLSSDVSQAGSETEATSAASSHTRERSRSNDNWDSEEDARRELVDESWNRFLASNPQIDADLCSSGHMETYEEAWKLDRESVINALLEYGYALTDPETQESAAQSVEVEQAKPVDEGDAQALLTYIMSNPDLKAQLHVYMHRCATEQAPTDVGSLVKFCRRFINERNLQVATGCHC